MVIYMYYYADQLLPVRDAIAELMKKKSRVVAAFDGRAASGKTMAAEWLAQQLDGEVIHMDDFFLPMELRCPERFEQPGGNVHYERFADQVLSGLKSNESFEYQVFDCSVMDYSGTACAGNRPLTIVEGVYSLHPAFEKYYDLAVFFHVDPEEQKRRILARNGAVMLNNFTERWIPLEEKYFAACGVEERCSITTGRTER